jgi:hypothetical protein
MGGGCGLGLEGWYVKGLVQFSAFFFTGCYTVEIQLQGFFCL